MPSVADQSVRSGVQGAPTFPVGAGVVGVPGTIFGVGLVAGRGAVWVGVRLSRGLLHENNRSGQG